MKKDKLSWARLVSEAEEARPRLKQTRPLF